jgi:hypothetical protein
MRGDRRHLGRLDLRGLDERQRGRARGRDRWQPCGLGGRSGESLRRRRERDRRSHRCDTVRGRGGLRSVGRAAAREPRHARSERALLDLSSPSGTKLRPSLVGRKASRLGAAKERESQGWSQPLVGARPVAPERVPLAGKELRPRDEQTERGGHHPEHLKGLEDHRLSSLAGDVNRTLASMTLISGKPPVLQIRPPSVAL